jgi:NodT family efflux transporter outer membrane factor (OMF) lipoprotein
MKRLTKRDAEASMKPGGRWLRAALFSIAVSALVSCAVGPDFERPVSPAPASYTDGPSLPERLEPPPAAENEAEKNAKNDAESAAIPASALAEDAAIAVQVLRPAEDIPARWWALFENPLLVEVVDRTIAGSPSLRIARANLAQAQETLVAARGSFFPQIDLGLSAQRSRSPALRSGATASTSNLYVVGPSASYVIDVFGAIRRSVEGQAALAEFQRYELAAAWLTLTGNAVSQSLSIASLRAQIDAVEGVLDVDRQNLDLVRRRFEAGKVARSDLLVAQTQLASDETLLPPLRQQLAFARHALAALAGEVPAAWTPPDLDLDGLVVPRELPVSLPSELTRQRPDVLAAESQLHAASAAIGVATAQLYPSLTLSGSITTDALEIGSLFTGAGTAWAVAGRVAAPLFRGGILRARRRAAIDAYDASLATYQQTVVQGFQQVADSLRALQYDALLVDASERLLATAEHSLALQQASYAAGKTSLLQMLSSARIYQQAQSGLARARGQRLQDTVQLFVALGGGWWQEEPLAPSATRGGDAAPHAAVPARRAPGR